MRTLEQILESIESKKKELTEHDKQYFGCENLENAIPKGRDGGSPIRGFNAPFNPYEITEHLTDGEFEAWYNHLQAELWKDIEKAGIKGVKCSDCSQPVKKPEDSIRWAGVIRHGNCFIDSVETGKMGITDFSRPFYERLKRAVFKM